jgi:uncharacterized protein YbjT (DUF2867 family)
VLLEEGHNEKTYNLTGPEAFTFTEAAAAFSAQTGREVRFESETVEEAYASRAVYDAPDWEVRGWVTTYTAVAAGDLELVTGDVRRLTGREPVSLAGYLSSL